MEAKAMKRKNCFW